MKLFVATANPHKFREIRQILRSLPLALRSLRDLGKKVSVQEGKKSFHDNAARKALSISRRYPDVWVAGEDSGLEVDALQGRPGVLSARFAGKDADYKANNRKLLDLLKGKKRKDRTAQFITMAALAHQGKIVKFFEGTVRGIIAEEEKGARGFGYDPVFFIPRMGKTFAELSAAQKNRMSHRARAFRKLEKFLKSYIAKHKGDLL